MTFVRTDGEWPLPSEMRIHSPYKLRSQSNCGQPAVPSCGVDQQSALKRRIGYYESWANARKCSSFSPEQIDTSTLTHVNFAFGLISSTFEIVEMTAGRRGFVAEDDGT